MKKVRVGVQVVGVEGNLVKVETRRVRHVCV